MSDARLLPRRIALLLLALALAGVAVASAPVHDALTTLVGRAEAFIARVPVAGAAVFVVLTALSAMIAFFSTGVLAPVAVATWGPLVTFAMLWVGWLAGGAVSYAIGRFLGRSVAGMFVDGATLDRWERLVRDRGNVTHLLLFQVAMPSEVLGYVLGLLRYSFVTYIAVLAATEIPYALAVVYLGESFLAGDTARFLIVGLAAVAVGVGLYFGLRRATQGRSG
ncbi:MAG: VTT domain-containing protein [Vicinamibacterales bacterium]